MASVKNLITHHTSHTMENGASGGNNGACRSSAACGDIELHGRLNGLDAWSGVSPPRTLNSSFSNYKIYNGTNTNGSHANGNGLTPKVAAVEKAEVGLIDNFKIIDSTLREGEQFATAFFTTAQKIKIAKALDEIGVEYIEVTSPAASEQSRADCETLCELGLKAKVLCHIRCNIDDAKIAVQTGVDGVNMCIGTSSQLMEHSHGKDLAFIAKKAKEVIEFLQTHDVEIRFSGEDSFRSDFAEIVKLYSIVDRLGVDRVGIADTVGGATPREVYDKVSKLRQVIGCDIETHFHNDTGCAIANAYCALEAGATHIDTTVLGIGERNGITPLSGLMRCLLLQGHVGVKSRYNLSKLSAIESLVAEVVEVEIPFNNGDLARFLKAPVNGF